MANEFHIGIVKKGHIAIKDWLARNPDDHLDLRGADLCGINLCDSDLQRADFSECQLTAANLTRANASGANFTRANLTKADLTDANFSAANLSFSHFADAELIRANFSVANLRHADFRDANLREANLSLANLIMANLEGVYLGYGNLFQADLERADLTNATLSYADLLNARLVGANLSGTNLTAAILTGADLSLAILSRVLLTETNFHRAIFDGTVLTDLDLSNCNGLNEAQFGGPCAITVETLYLSNGQIPEHFLRGCGVPEGLIVYLPSLVGMQSPIEFYSCFISYSHDDEEFCKRLHSRMRDERLRVWLASEDVKVGRKLHEQIDDAIRVYDKLLLVLSKKSVASNWVNNEIYKARKREAKEKRQIIVPIRLVPLEELRDWEAFDSDTGRDMAREIREYYIPDFSKWRDHDSFEVGFKKLLDALKLDARKDV